MRLKKLLKAMVSLAVAVCLLIPFVACGSDIQVDSVELDRATHSLNVGDEVSLAYTVFPLSSSNAKAKWKSSDTTVATVNDGTVKGVAEGVAAIRVTIGDKSATCNVTVNDPSKASVPATGVTLNRSTLALTGGGSETLTATVVPENTTYKTIIWSSSKTSVVTVGSNGVVTGRSTGVAVITAKTLNGFTASCVVTVTGSGDTANDGLYVAKIASLEGRDDFIMGIDASEVLSIEEARKANYEPLYKNFKGEEEDVFKILKDNGVTDIRIRIWNDPTDGNGHSYGGGNCDVDNAVEISKRCKAVGLGVIIDFHYSDFWADPAKQKAPKAWASMTTSQVEEALYTFTKESLEEIKATNVKITMVQIGNETTGAMAGATNWTTICKYFNQGSRAVRDVTGAVANGGAKVAVHFTNAGNGNYLGLASTLANNNVDYDVFGTSWYPYYSSHGTLANLATQLKNIHSTYGKEAMVLETAYAFTYEDFDGCGNTALESTTQPVTVQGMSNAVRDVIVAIADLGDWGLGVCYWGGIWISASTSSEGSVNRAICKEYGCGWATSYAKGYDSDANDGGTMVDNNAFFLSDGTPLESLKVFKDVYTGHVTDIMADYLYDQEVYYTVNEGEIELPDTVEIVLNNGSKQTVQAYWNVEQSDLTKYITKVNQYDIQGTTEYGGTCHVYVWVMNVNLLTEGSFEGFTSYGDSTTQFVQTTLGDWKLDYTRGTGDLQLFVSNNAGNARMGTNSFHFWDSTTVSFELSQTLDVAKLSTYGNGSYGCSFDFQGADGDNLDIYAFITVTYKDGTTQTFKGNKATMEGWQNWVRTSVSGVELDLSNVVSVKVGIHVYAEALGNGPWGNIDNAQFYFES